MGICFTQMAVARLVICTYILYSETFDRSFHNTLFLPFILILG